MDTGQWRQLVETHEAMKYDEPDMVDNPPHYNHGSIETIEYIEDVQGKFFAAHYCWGNVLKYLGTRLFLKGNPLQDAKKARWYLDRMIKNLEETKDINW